ncbi:MAG: CRTAC1 family protein [Imperialibacter sp.]|uniref:CRTAC1 family protein n=1 Tax=Imperialibacter sp. TaxID=2038411 RepID=UPI0032EBF451
MEKRIESPVNTIVNNLKVIWLVCLALASFAAQAQLSFKDVTDEAGIGHHQFVVYEGMFGGGICVFDFNNDGWDDFFITSGMETDRLYLNNGDGTFRDVYASSGLVVTGAYVTQGAASADVNRDGWVDLLVTTITLKDSSQQIPRAENLLFLNNGNSTFRDATEEYGLKDLQSFSTGASFGDFNLDGFPDIYIGNYFLAYEGKLSAINDATIVNASSTAEGYLLVNHEGKYFANEYEDYGLKFRGFGFGGVFTDYDNDHDPDIVVNHDFGYKATPDVLLNNQYPDDEFVDVAEETGMDLKINSMGIAVGDYDNNGLLDYYVTNIRFNRFMVNQGPGKPFVDKARELGMGFVSISWGANFADFDHDMDVDLFVTNGDLNPNDVPMANFFFENDKGAFTDKAHLLGLNDYGVGRGSVVFDMDNDGDLDILYVSQKPVLDFPVESRTRLFRNDSKGGNWLKIALKGTDSELNGLGSRVEVVAGGVKMMREIDGGSSHLSQNALHAHFGLGTHSIADSVIVTWLGGERQVLLNQPTNQLLVVTEPESKGLGWPMTVGFGFVTALVAAWAVRRFTSK